jgi:hypothetical protein
MEKLSVSLKAKINHRPTKTFVKTTTPLNWEKNIPKNNMKRRLDVSIPKNFDGKKVWNNMLSPVKNQGSCGACWSFASTSTLADRFNILSKGLLHIDLSAAKLILCDQGGKEFDIVHPEEHRRQTENTQRDELSDTACYGSSLEDAWRYLYLIGTNTSQCVPYDKNYGKFKQIKSLGNFTYPVTLPSCVQVSGIFGDMCTDFTYDISSGEELGTPARFYRCEHFYSISGIKQDGGSEYNIRHNIYLLGPVSSAIVIYPDFYTFDAKNDIYKWDGKGPVVGGHAIEIVGWGEEKNIKYWIIKNSWGIKWGDEGYFKMVRGENNCEIERNIFTGIPDFFTRGGLPNLYEWGDSKFESQMSWVEDDVSATAGGIDPETGYTRRIMDIFPGLNYTRPLPLKNIPDFKTFIAGKDSVSLNQIKGRNQIKSVNKLFSVFLIVLIILFSLVIIFIIILFMRKNTSIKVI